MKLNRLWDELPGKLVALTTALADLTDSVLRVLSAISHLLPLSIA